MFPDCDYGHRKKFKASRETNVDMLKKLLMSRDVKNQLKAVSFIIESLQEDNYEEININEFYINKDICVFLCEAIATLHEQLLRNILRCLKIFSNVKVFYKTSVAPHVVSSLVRTAHFLVKEDRLEEMIENIMHLLSEIFIKNNKLNLPSPLTIESAHNPVSLFELQSLIFKHPNLSFDIKIINTLILHTILHNAKNVKMLPATAVFLTQTFTANMDVLSHCLIDINFDSNIKSKLDIVFGMICHLCIDIFELCIGNKHKIDLELDKQLQEVAYSSICNLVAEMKDLPSAEIVPSYDLFLSMLLKYLQHNKEPFHSLTSHLCSNNFLVFLPKLQSSKLSNKITKLCYKTLLEIIYVLSSENFDLEKWPSGKDSFCKHIDDGLLKISCEWVKWPELLNERDSSNAVKHFVIVYLYFYCLNSKSPQTVATSLLPYLLNYVLAFQPNVKINCIIAKCLWFIFAMADLSNVKKSPSDPHVLYLNKAVDKVANLVSANIKDLYTHHPALVVWVFSSNRIPCRIQNQVLSFWLEKEKNLPLGLESMDSVWCALLNILQSAPSNVTAIAAEQLKMCIETYGKSNNMDYIKAILWDVLPETLNSFCLQRELIYEETIISLMQLCSSNIPNNPTLTTVQRTVFSLVNFVSYVKNIDSRNAMALLGEIFCLIEISLKLNDYLVFTQIVKSPKFLQCIYDFCKSENENVSVEAIRLISCLLYYTTLFKLKSDHKIKFDPLIIMMSFRDSNNTEKIVSLIQLLYSLTNPINLFNRQSLITFHSEEGPIKVKIFFRALFFRLQMVACKDIKNESNNALLCMNRMLEFAAKQSDENDLIIHLVFQPWTHTLIRFYFASNCAKINLNLLKFVFRWLSCFKIVSNDCKFDVKETDNIMCRTFLNILKAFDQEEFTKCENEKKKQLTDKIVNLIATFYK